MQNARVGRKHDLVSTIHTVHAYKDGQWIITGYRCVPCNRALKTEQSVTKHLTVCSSINTTKEIEIMPIQRIVKNGEAYYRYGDQGKLYKTKQEAEQQMRAILASGYKEAKKPQ